MKVGGAVFPIGVDNVAYAKYFTGQTYLAPLTPAGVSVGVSNVTFAPGVINHWHTHQKSCQVLVGVSGKGYYQIWGEEPKEILPGTTVTIPENVKHWHGGSHESWFQHLSIMSPGAGTTWMEPVDPAVYAKLK
ncbi:cupin domain-containing protein [Sutterella sp.]|uniref:cupin domain-containing protein n=1 Tax=Sutterella sp. TaxID=1981025 RepID=UPI0026E11003|nr:cupin domain-containing protein [Sutterella sp.]MDO5532705.1 cupin domain-containing protein [Sutterella sp.]